MRRIILTIILFLGIGEAQEWLFNGFIRISVSPTDAGIAQAFNIPNERFYQTKLLVKIKAKDKDRIEIVFADAEVRLLNNKLVIKPEFDLADNIVSRRLILQKTEDGYQFYDDPDHILKEILPFDPNLLCMMLDLTMSVNVGTAEPQPKEEQKTHTWSMPYLNQDKYRVLERLLVIISHSWGTNQYFTMSINRDEVYKSNKINVSGMSDGLGDGIISHRDDGGIYMINATLHLDKSILVTEQGREGRLTIVEEHDFVLEIKP